MARATAGVYDDTVILDDSLSIDGWETYPAGIDGFNPFDCDASEARVRFNAQADLIFSETDPFIDIIDATAFRLYKADHVSHFKDDDVIRHIKANVPELRIISVLRKHSLSPLMVSKDLLLKILKFHNIGSCFLELLPAFRTVEELSEKAQSLCSVLKSTDKQIELCYNWRYIEKNDHGHGQAWSERQIGVYHRFGGAGRSIMILLHANTSTRAHARLQHAFSQGSYEQRSNTSPLSLHILILSSYLGNWRPYLQHLGQWCLAKENHFLTVELKHPSVNFAELQELRDRESRLSVASTVLASTMVVIQSIEDCGRGLTGAEGEHCNNHSKNDSTLRGSSAEMQSLRVLRMRCSEYLASVELIQHRLDVVIGLLSDGLNQQSQRAANSIADSSRKLALDSVKDNYIVKVVTVITVVYLPMQGVASFFGMNLTRLSAETNKLGFAGNWWLFLATAIPLTIITLGVLVIAWILEKRRRAKDVTKDANTP